jgi:hypothetical protein
MIRSLFPIAVNLPVIIFRSLSPKVISFTDYD